MDILIQAGQFILSLSILIVLHELGHFIPAKLFKTRVEKFYLFFDPWFSVVKKKIGGTEYGIGWLPLGGYVKISGMIDESMDKEQMAKPAESWEFRSKPAWQRLIIMLGGVTVNVFLGFFIYSMVLFGYGEKVLPNKNLTDGVWVMDSLALNLGFKTGDKIVSINGVEPVNFTDVMPELLYGGNTVVERGPEKVDINIPVNFAEQLTENGGNMLFMPRIPFIVGGFADSSLNKTSGLEPLDRIVAVNNTPIKYFDEGKDIIASNAGKTVEVSVIRNEEPKTFTLQVSNDGFIGVAPGNIGVSELRKLGVYEFDVKEYGFFESFGAGYTKAFEKLSSYVRQFALILNPETGAYKGLGGFISIGGLFPTTWDGEFFWNMTAFLSLILAVMNILPIPALDGGHVMFLLYEVITGRKPHDKVMEYAQMAGMALLLALLLFANGNDVIRKFF